MATVDESIVRPFEWLTSAESLHGKLSEALEGKEHVRVLHVGCGSSILGEFLVQHFPQVVDQVVNVDNDAAILQAMEKRWTESCPSSNLKEKMKFVCVDLCGDSIPLEDGSFDVAIDKSTLDCLLCSDKGASSLIREMHRLLNPRDGVYLMISFHHINFLRPLLEDCPGTHWKVSHSVMYRHVEDLVGPTNQITNLATIELDETMRTSAWTSKGFQPDEIYHRTVNVLVCRNYGQHETTIPLDATAVYDHVNKCSDDWYRQQNPMLTQERIDQIRDAFQSQTTLPLDECYGVLFTAEEREHLSFDDFVEDWKTFLKSHADLSFDEISFDIALRFLSEMQ